MKSNKELSKMKIVGNEPTHFEFTAKAEQIYANTDPLRIYELYDEDEDRYYYCLRGVFEEDDIDDKKVNSLIESLSDHD